jgi:hypothetical protein
MIDDGDYTANRCSLKDRARFSRVACIAPWRISIQPGVDTRFFDRNDAAIVSGRGDLRWRLRAL